MVEDKSREQTQSDVNGDWERTALEMMDFIEKHPSCYHVIQGFEEILSAQGFEKLEEHKSWKLQPGGSYYVDRNGSSLIAFRIPEKSFCNFQMVASHSDSPSFKIKEHPEMQVDGHYIQLNVEKYGGMLCAPWFDRPLSVAGRVIVREPLTGGKGDLSDETGEHMPALRQKLVNLNRDLVLLPNLAIHMDRKLNDGYSYNAQKDMIPLFGDEKAAGMFEELVAKEAGVSTSDLLAKDLFLYNRMPGTVWGAHREYISSPRLDDLQCAWASVQGLIQGGHPETVSVCCIFDNEEVGSGTKQGAASTFLQDVLQRICICTGYSQEEYRMLLAGSFLLSADNAHAVHPSHLDKADPTNRPYMNHGIVIKYNANQKYTTDAVSAAVFREICRRAGVPVQSYTNRSDVAGGSTLGNIASGQVSVNMVDIGLAQLAMHSPYETAGVRDTWYMLQAVKAFYHTKICLQGENISFSTK